MASTRSSSPPEPGNQQIARGTNLTLVVGFLFWVPCPATSDSEFNGQTGVFD